MAFRKKQSFEGGGVDVSATKYMDMVITCALTVLPKAIENGESMNSALLSLTISVDQLENICKANNLLQDNDEEYKAALAKFSNDLKEKDEALRRAMIGNFKMRLLMQLHFESGIKDAELSV